MEERVLPFYWSDCAILRMKYLSLLTTQSHLGGHNTLSFGDERAFGATTITPATVTLVALEGRNDAVVAATGALGCPLIAFRRPHEEGCGGGSRRRWDAVVVLRIDCEKVLRVHHGTAGCNGCGGGGGSGGHGVAVLAVLGPV